MVQNSNRLLEDLKLICDLIKIPSKEHHEGRFGFKATEENKLTIVTAVAPHSIAAKASLAKGDEIIAINEIKVEGNLDALSKYFSDEAVVMTIFTQQKKLKDVVMTIGKESYYHQYKIVKRDDALPEQKQFFRRWLKCDF